MLSRVQALPAASFPLDIPKPSIEERSFPALLANDMWSTVGGQSIQTLDFTHSKFGFAISLTNPDTSTDREASIYAVVMRIIWLAPGQTGSPGFSVPPLSTPVDTFPFGIVFGSIIGGTIVVFGLVVLIIYLARRAAIAQPAIVLDAPLADYQKF